MNTKKQSFVPWRRYCLAIAEAVLIFTLASFLLGLYIIHRGNSGTVTMVLCAIFYALAIGYTIYRMVRKFSIPALMLMVPIAPLVIMIIVVSLIHLLQFFR